MLYGAFICARGVSPAEPCWEVAAKALWRAFELGATVSDAEGYTHLKMMIEALETRPGFEDLFRNQPKMPEKLASQFVMLDELGY